MTHWTDFGIWQATDIHWDRFQASRADPDLVKLVKAASLVEHNAPVYAQYLCNVFHDDPAFAKLAKDWSDEEVKHGKTLARYAMLADPDFDFDVAFKRYTEGFRVPVDVSESVRGSLTGEILARCVVETGTSSHYTAIRRATDEPLLQELCRNLAADELRHYKTFWEFSKKLREKEGIGLVRRARVVIGRVAEAQDEELAYAFHSANEKPGSFNLKRSNETYAGHAYGLYPPYLLERIVAMLLNVIGLKPHGRLNRLISRLAHWKMQRRARRFAATQPA
ncbi:MAG: ferritin-like domain-containing protein [Alphaproteobacteria bacterium]|nr:ferritin-like domain-containing protein [Alphaproteobacteria bacterium]